MVYGLQLNSKKLAVVFASYTTMEIAITPQYKNYVHKADAVSLAYNSHSYTSTCTQTRFGVYATDMHTCLCKLSCTRPVCTRVLCMRNSMSSILCAHACMYPKEMKNVLYQVHDIHMFSQLSCTLINWLWRFLST